MNTAPDPERGVTSSSSTMDAAPPRSARLGEELPIFCERCGYALHGSPQVVCDRCAIRHFACPECGHHQPINTLRPAAQRVLGRVRSWFLGLAIIVRINFFGWLLVAWTALAHDIAYIPRYTPDYTRRGVPNYVLIYVPGKVTNEMLLASAFFGLAFGAVGRMLLLRWRHGYRVGLILGALVVLAMLFGVYLRYRGLSRETPTPLPLPSPVTGDFRTLLCIAFASVSLGASTIWGMWSALAHLFLPKRTAHALLGWQRSQSDRAAVTIATP